MSTLVDSVRVTNHGLLESIRATLKSQRPGIGTKSKLLFCHPDNADALNAVCKKACDHPDIHVIKPYRVRTSFLLPKTAQFPTGNMVWHNTRFIDYSAGPADNSNLEDYIKMCEYFGFAEPEMEERSVWFEVDDDTFKKVLDASMIPIIEGQNRKIADKIFSDISNNLVFERASKYLGVTI